MEKGAASAGLLIFEDELLSIFEDMDVFLRMLSSDDCLCSATRTWLAEQQQAEVGMIDGCEVVKHIVLRDLIASRRPSDWEQWDEGDEILYDGIESHKVN